MHMNNRLPSFYLLVIFCALSMPELTGVQAAILFFLIALILGVLTHKKDVMISPVAFIIVAYMLAFPLPMLFPGLYPDLWHAVLPQALESGMLWSVRGFAAFALGHALVEQLGKRARKRRWRDDAFYSARLSYTVYVLTCIGWLAILAWVISAMLFGITLVFIESDSVRANSVTGTLHQMLTMLFNLRYPFFLGFLILLFWKKIDRHLILLFVALFLVSLVEIITIGSKGSIIRGMVVFLLAQAFLPVRLNLKQAIFSLVALIAIYGSFAVITEYRTIMKAEYQAGRDVLEFTGQVESFKSALLSALPSSETATDRLTEVKREAVFSRFGAGMFSFANLMRFTGWQSPYEHAWESFLVPVYSIVPRTLMPGKPEFFDSGSNAQQYYGLSYGGVSVTLLGSLYYAWGYTGIIFGMAFVGGLFAYVVGRVRLLGYYSPHWLILLVVLMVPMLDVGVTIQAIIINFLRVAIVLWLLHLLFPLVRGSMLRRMSRFSGPIKRESRP